MTQIWILAGKSLWEAAHGRKEAARRFGSGSPGLAVDPFWNLGDTMTLVRCGVFICFTSLLTSEANLSAKIDRESRKKWMLVANAESL